MSYPNFSLGFLTNSTYYGTFYLVIVKFLRSSNSSVNGNINDLPPIVIWSANGNSLVKKNAILELTAGGDLILRDVDNRHVWSTNTFGRYIIQMSLDVNNAKDKWPWHSLGFPTNTWLPGQRLRLHTHLTATVVASNLSTGMFFITLFQNNLHLYFNLSIP